MSSSLGKSTLASVNLSPLPPLHLTPLTVSTLYTPGVICYSKDNGAHGRPRSYNLPFRRRTLYPIELRAQSHGEAGYSPAKGRPATPLA